MEGYLKHLLNDFAESDSTNVNIVDDNYSSLSSLPEPGTFSKRLRSRPSVRRASSLNSAIVKNRRDPSDHRPKGSKARKGRRRQLPGNTNVNSDRHMKQLSARMERHRRSRWDASPCSTPSIPSPRNEFQYSPSSKNKALHPRLHSKKISLLDITKHERRSISPLKDFFDDHRIDDREGSSRSLSDDVAISHQMVIRKALAISNGDMEVSFHDSCSSHSTRSTVSTRSSHSSRSTISTRSPHRTRSPHSTTRSPHRTRSPHSIRPRTRKNDVPSRRVNATRLSRSDSMSFLPPVPKRRSSIDECELPITQRLSNLPEERVSTDSRFQVPSSLRELPYFQMSTQTV